MIIKPRKSTTIPYSKIIPLFDQGLSTRQIAKLLGGTSTLIWQLLFDIGLGRSRSAAALLRQPSKSVHPRSTRAAARKLWARTYGDIPVGHHIHHIDGDCTNNSLENLECLSASDHLIKHWDEGTMCFQRAPIIPRHKRPERKKYMNQYQTNNRKVASICSVCSNEFQRDKYSKAQNIFCSHSCAAKFYWKRKNAA